MRETALETSRPEQKEHRELVQTWSKESPAVHGADHGDAGCAHEAHGGPWQSRYPHYMVCSGPPWRTTS